MIFPLSHKILIILMNISGDLHGFTGLAAGVLAEAFSLSSQKVLGKSPGELL